MELPDDTIGGDIHGGGDDAKRCRTRQATQLACAKHIWFSVDDLDWFISAMNHQFTTGGIPPVQKDATQATTPQTNISWNFRDSRWEGRAKQSDKWYRRAVAPRRVRRGNGEIPEASYAVMKQGSYDELCQWQSLVEEGGEPGQWAAMEEASAEHAA